MIEQIFKAYDIRGTYPDQINEEIAYKLGRAFVEFLKCSAVVVGRDARLSSDSLFESLTKGIIDSGADVIDIGRVSTPMCYFAIGNYELHDAGIMITASHNPKEYNGFKLCREDVSPISLETGLQEIKELVVKNKFPQRKVGQIIETDILSDYVKTVLNFADFSELDAFRIVIDAGNGVAGRNILEIFKKIKKCQLFSLYFDPDGNFPNHEANPLKKENLKDLQKEVIEKKADFGVAFDGDADRICFVDEKGESISGDLLTVLIAKEILKENPNEKILYDLRSSWVVREEIEKAGGIPVMTRVGHGLIKNHMRQEKAIFAGELSFHYYFRDLFYAENADLVLLLILKLLTEEKKTLSEIIVPLKKYFHSGEINFEVKDKEAKMKELAEKYQRGKISWLDGVYIEYKDWWFNVRPSNTEPLLRLNLEAKTKELLEEKKEELSKTIQG